MWKRVYHVIQVNVGSSSYELLHNLNAALLGRQHEGSQSALEGNGEERLGIRLRAEYILLKNIYTANCV